MKVSRSRSRKVKLFARYSNQKPPNRSSDFDLKEIISTENANHREMLSCCEGNHALTTVVESKCVNTAKPFFSTFHCRAIMTHASVPKDQREILGISDTLV